MELICKGTYNSGEAELWSHKGSMVLRTRSKHGLVDWNYCNESVSPDAFEYLRNQALAAGA